MSTVKIKAADSKLTVTGNKMAFTANQLKNFYDLSPEIIVKHILPFVGGVRGSESKITALGNQLKTFLQIAENTFNGWAQSSIGIHQSCSCSVPVTIGSNGVYNTVQYQDRGVQFKYRIDKTLDPTGNKYGQKYIQGQLNFPPEKLLEFWIYVDNLSLNELQLVSIETLLLYIRAHPLKINYPQYYGYN